MKLCMAVIVIAIHTNPENSFSWNFGREIQKSIYNVAVPYFFMASGFLLFRKVQFPLNIDGQNRVRKYLLRICRMYIVWTLLYLPFTIWGFGKDGVSFMQGLIIFVRNVLLVGENFYSWPLWYLLALMIAVFIIGCCLSWGLKVKHIFLIAVLFHILGLGIDYCRDNGIALQFTEVYYTLFKSTRNGFFIGLLYVTLGIWAAYKRVAMNKSILFIGILIGFWGNFFRIPFGDVLFAYSVFALTLKLELRIISVEICAYMRNMSTVVYFIHMYWVVLWSYVFLQHNSDSLNVFVLSLVFSLLSGIILLYYKDRTWFRACFQ